MAAIQAPGTSQRSLKASTTAQQRHISNQVDPWSDVLEYTHNNEHARCEAWKDEVNNLLIFAGLFSAIITTFLLDSYKSLSQDPNDVVIVLLSRIISQLQNTTQTSSPDIPFSPTASAKRINVFWFLSLVLSLAAVLIGTICLQWLRVHQRPLYGVKPQTAVSLIQMQSKSLNEWYVPQIFAALPLLLQLALALFLSGIVEFLWHINRPVTYPILVAVCLLFLFLLLSTWLPALQEVFPMRSKGEMVPSPCPYSSPQSRLFLSFGLYVKRLMIKKNVLPPSPSAFHSVCRGHTHGENCQSHQECWLYYRDIDTKRHTSNVPPTEGEVHKSLKSRKIPSLYDSMLALHRVQTTVPKLGSNTHECLDSIISEGKEAEGEFEKLSDREEFRAGYLRHVLRLLRLSSNSYRLPDFPPSTKHEILGDEIQVRFSGQQEKPLYLTDRIVAAHIQFTKWLMFEEERPVGNAPPFEWVTDDKMELPLEWIADMDLSNFPEVSWLTIDILKEVLNHTHTLNDNYPRYISRFLPEAAKVLAKALPSNDSAQEEHEIFLDIVASRLTVEESSSTSFEPNSYLYLATSRYAARLESERDRHSPSLQLPELKRLDSVLEDYKSAIVNNRRSKQVRDLADRLSLPAYLPSGV